MHSNPILDLAGGEAALPPVLARAHRGHAKLFGAVDVERGGLPASIIAAIAGMPEAGRGIPFFVTGDHRHEAVSWLRNFDGVRFDSTFEREGDHLIERHGPLQLRLKIVVEDGRLTYRLIDARCLGFTLPAWLTPSLDAWEAEEDGRYQFEVAISLPGVGLLARYGGLLDPS